MSDNPAAGVAAERTNAPAQEPAAATSSPVAAAALPESAAGPAAAETAPAPAATEAAAETAPAIDAQSRAPSLLSGDAAKPEAPAVEGAKPAVGAASADGETPVEVPAAAEPLVYEKFAVPEGVSLDDERVGAFREVIAPLRVPQEEAQKLVDLHIAEMHRHADHVAREQHRVFAEMRRGWAESFESDPELGGNRRDTTIGNALWAIGELGGDAAQVKELREMLTFTGAGDHPALIRLMSNAAMRLRERSVPPPGLPPKPGGGGRPEDRRYPNM